MKRSISDEETDPCGCKVIVISDDEEEVPVKPENSRILRDESSGRISKRLAIEVSKDQAMDEEEGEGQPKQHNEMVGHSLTFLSASLKLNTGGESFSSFFYGTFVGRNQRLLCLFVPGFIFRLSASD